MHIAAVKNAASVGERFILSQVANRCIYGRHGLKGRGLPSWDADRLTSKIVEVGQSVCTCPTKPATLQSNLYNYTTLANSWLSSDVILEGNQRKEAGTSLYWNTMANHADKKTSAENPIVPMDA